MSKRYDFKKARRANEVPALAKLQAQASELATFEIQAHFEIAGRGVVIAGRVLSGVFHGGQHASGVRDFAPVMITSVEFIDTGRDGTTGLVFKEHQGIAALRSQFPVGSILTAKRR